MSFGGNEKVDLILRREGFVVVHAQIKPFVDYTAGGKGVSASVTGSTT